MNNEKVKIEFNGAMIFGAAVYVGVVIAATTLFISFILSAFPADAYLSRIVMTLAGLLVGASMVAFPVALHLWVFEKTHRVWATIFYYGEMVIVFVNTIVSFMTLLSKNTGYAVPEWAVLYEPFSVGALIYTLLAWGTVFLLDPAHQAIQQEREFKGNFQKKVSKKKLEYLDTAEGHASIQAAADAEVMRTLEESKPGVKHWGAGVATPAPANSPFTTKAAVSPSPLPEADDDQS